MEGTAGPLTPSVSVAQLAELYARDSREYCRTFFPRAFRKPSPHFHKAIWEVLDDPRNREVGIEVFRGGAKTTLLRAFASKRIAYGISKTIMILSASQTHALKSTRWIRQAIEFNKKWAQFYQLKPGTKWTDEWLEIEHGILGEKITIIAAGVTGQTRGLNVDDHRPDLIIVDDPSDEENTATPESRKKIEERFFGAINKSLAPPADNPEAKMVLLQTSLHKDDLINRCHQDSTWTTLKFSAFDADGRSQWPSMWTTEQLMRQKQAHADRGQMLLWLREMECTVGDEETAVFKKEWLKFWEILPEKMITVLSIDPTPPPSEAQIKKGLRDKDSEVISVVGYSREGVFLLEQRGVVDHDPEWTVKNALAMAMEWKVLKIRVEGIAYQRTLKYYLEKAMRAIKFHVLVEATADKRKKRHRIFQAFSGVASQGLFHCHRTHLDFIAQFSAYPNVDHDDYVDSAAMGVEACMELAMFETEDDEISELLGAESDIHAIDNWREAP